MKCRYEYHGKDEWNEFIEYYHARHRRQERARSDMAIAAGEFLDISAYQDVRSCRRRIYLIARQGRTGHACLSAPLGTSRGVNEFHMRTLPMDVT